MTPQNERSSLKRGRANKEHDSKHLKKARRSEELPPQPTDQLYLPTPIVQQELSTRNDDKELAETANDKKSVQQCSTPLSTGIPQPSPSPPHDTQALSQFVYPPRAFADEVEDEAAEGVWGYLLPLDDKVPAALVLRKRSGCESHGLRSTGVTQGEKGHPKEPESKNKRESLLAPGGYLVGRHRECDLVLKIPTVSNRHFLLFPENKKGDSIAVLEDLSSNGTFVNDAIVGRNQHRELEDGDEITILDQARFVFRYPRIRDTNRFRQQYRILQQLGKGHFASVYLCVERATGIHYAVKLFEKRSSDSQKSQTDALQQEIGLLMGVSHPNLLCLKDTFDESDGVYLVLELASEGELFNLIVSKQRFSETETRHIFIQIFEGLKYLHDRGIVHRDIKPENILVADQRLTVKLGDFGLAKIIGEDSFTTTLCGTPSSHSLDVAPEILQESRRRKYTKAVDIWSLGVVLYICLCGFPPFSDELYTPENPYTLAQQIKMGRFDYPSPYWDSVGDPALDLIDKMLTVDVDKRITVDECLEHPWLTQTYPSLSDSTDGLTGALDKLDFSKRKLARERTLLSHINDVSFNECKERNGTTVRVFHNSHTGKRTHNHPAKVIKGGEACDNNSAPKDFINLGEQGDPLLYPDEAGPSHE
ncbi:Pkinase-domain-containing protein [Aspergillus uvarum CBS 121591]|uniref:Pkinase-domain-containing protein n=1 Tax=Aspergillus uvarum CBS 121591 TaxID=1448315 RepID=A0A319DQ73_9EURO|nr:Pkinase-domain-containing protein [Aspergillus uvarum CBS 121591]PYH81402.1 Pkinase-domain-containing protein [Aspergillus uvarum CBS 121591]